MSNLMELIQGQMQSGLLDQLTNALPGASKEQTSSASQLAIGTLLSALTKNASNPSGLDSLVGALSNTHYGGILNNIGDLLGGSMQGNKAADGMGILGHLLGDSNIFNVINLISKGSGMSRNNSMSLLMNMAPIVLGMLGKQKQQQQLAPNNLFDMLSNSQQQVRQQMPKQDIFTRILDKDGDGSAIDEVAGMGMKLLGGLFK